MNPRAIYRVHGDGDAAPPVWPGELCELLARGGSSQEWEMQCAEAFARANGWSVHRGRPPRRFAGLDFTRDVLPLTDHVILFHERGGVAALVSHDYSPRRDFSAFAGQIIVDHLPRSWYRGGGVDATTAYLMRPAR